MKVTGPTGLREFSTSGIAYYYVRNDTVRIFYNNDSFLGLICRSHYHATITAMGMFANDYRNFLTLCGTDGVSYYVNISEVDSTSVSGAVLTVTVAGTAIQIPCKDAATADWDKQYVDANKEGRTFLNTFGGLIRTVGPGKDYATINLAMAAATSGQAVRVYPGELYGKRHGKKRSGAVYGRGGLAKRVYCGLRDCIQLQDLRIWRFQAGRLRAR